MPLAGSPGYSAAADADQAARILAHPGVRRVAGLLASYGVRGQVTALGAPARTAREAAVALGVDVAQIANSLVFRGQRPDGKDVPLLVLISGAHRVDVVKLADLLGLVSIGPADPSYVQQSSGFAIGGVPPIGHAQPMTTAVDVSLGRYAEVWAAAGHPNAVFPTSYDEILRITGGHSAEVA